MKKIVWIVCLATAVAVVACNDSGSQGDSVQNADDSNAVKARSDSMAMQVDKNAADFAVQAADAGMKEVALGQLAQVKGVDKRVKSFGEMMVNDHTLANDKLRSLAAQKNITLPDSLSNDAKKEIGDLQKKNGRDFDKAYVGMMENGHKKVVDDFRKASQDLSDAELKTFATETLPTLQKHLDSITVISKALKGK
ncbi:MAG: DUF4142 domain-containing protein [Chitinophagaceae bacterium]